mmetsp:Transcript_24891/g.71974  ORF Transcript_24891/g.71974 Transcript_24891/m.71974 type:complete len:406 (+) Transcript_24891:1627-2844(+)
MDADHTERLCLTEGDLPRATPSGHAQTTIPIEGVALHPVPLAGEGAAPILLGIERSIGEVVPRPVPVHGARGPRIGQRHLPMRLEDGEARQPSRRAALPTSIVAVAVAVVAPPRQGTDGHVKVAHCGSGRRFGTTAMVTVIVISICTAQHNGVPLGAIPCHEPTLQAGGEHLESGADPPPPFVRAHRRRHPIHLLLLLLLLLFAEVNTTSSVVVVPFERTPQPLRGLPRPELGVVPIGLDDVSVVGAHNLGGRQGEVGTISRPTPSDRIVDAEDEGEAGVPLGRGEGEAVVPSLHEAAGFGPAGVVADADAAPGAEAAEDGADPIALPSPPAVVVGGVGGEEVPAGMRRLLRVGPPPAVLRCRWGCLGGGGISIATATIIGGIQHMYLCCCATCWYGGASRYRRE